MMQQGDDAVSMWPQEDEQGSRQKWCTRTRVATICVDNDDAVDDMHVRAAARALRQAGWDVDVKPEVDIENCPRSTLGPPPVVLPCSPPSSDGDGLPRRFPRAVRRAALRAASGGPFKVSIIVEEHHPTVLTGLLLIPDSYAHGVICVMLEAHPKKKCGVSIAQQAMDAAARLGNLGHSIGAMEMLLGESDGPYHLWLLTGGPWSRGDARQVAAALTAET
jgi:hypothetical protein